MVVIIPRAVVDMILLDGASHAFWRNIWFCTASECLLDVTCIHDTLYPGACWGVKFEIYDKRSPIEQPRTFPTPRRGNCGV